MEKTINRKYSWYQWLIFIPLCYLLKFACVSCILIIRPLLGPASCKFQETCTPFSIRQFKEKPLLSALYEIAKRLFSCSPF